MQQQDAGNKNQTEPPYKKWKQAYQFTLGHFDPVAEHDVTYKNVMFCTDDIEKGTESQHTVILTQLWPRILFKLDLHACRFLVNVHSDMHFRLTTNQEVNVTNA